MIISFSQPTTSTTVTATATATQADDRLGTAPRASTTAYGPLFIFPPAIERAQQSAVAYVESNDDDDDDDG